MFSALFGSSKDKRDEDLISATKKGKKDDVERLLRSGADVNSKNSTFRCSTVLMIAAERGHIYRYSGNIVKKQS